MFLEILAVAVVLYFVITKLRTGSTNLPPGPKPYPVLGNLTQLIKGDIFEHMKNWQQLYGDTFCFRVGSSVNVVLCNAETARKVLSDDNTTGRDTGQLAMNGLRRDGILHGLVTSEHELWKEHRRFTLTALRDMGMGKTWLEDSILSEVNDLCTELRRHQDEPFNPKTLLLHSVSNVICAMVFGKRFSHSDERFPKMVTLISESLKELMGTAILDIVPVLKYIPGAPRNSLRNWKAMQQKVFDFIQELIDEHAARPESEQVDDYIAIYQREAKKLRNTESGKTFTDFQLVAALYDLFTAGTETTATTITWAIVFMIEHPDVLKRAQSEINEKIAEGESIRMSDRGRLPYTEAVILEIQRVSSAVAFSVPHLNFQEMKIDGYDIPRGTTILLNIHSIHRDERYWTEPAEFNPERFLDADGKVMRPEGFMPFAVGKRSCLGESLAKMELWLFLANLFKNFTFKEVPGNPVNSKLYERSGVLSPKPYDILFVPNNLK